MEVVGITASLAGLLSLAAMVIQCGYMYAEAAVKWKGEIRAITKEIIQLTGLLHTLQPMIDELSIFGT